MSKWIRYELGYAAKVQGGYAFKSNRFQSEGVPIIRIGNLNGETVHIDKKICYPTEFWNNNPDFQVHKNDILIAMSGATVGKVGLYNDEKSALLNQRVGKISANEKLIDNQYLYRYVKSNMFNKQIIERASGCAQPNISASQISEISIPIPPLETQKHIAKTLDTAAGLFTMGKQQLAELDNLIKSVFYDIFGDPVTNEKEWHIEKLVNITTKIGSGATPKGGRESYQIEGITLIRSMNVHNGVFKYDDLAHIDDNQAKQLENVTIEKNDVLINITGASVARSCIVPINVLPARVNQHVSIVRLNEKKALSEYINNMFINDSFQTLLLSIAGAGGATREAITKQQLQELIIPIPPIEMQKQFASIVTKIEEQKSLVKKAIDETQLLFDSLMSQYFD